MSNILKRIISVFIIAIYLTSIIGYGVHVCDNDGSVEVVSLINKSASCSDIHSNEMGCHSCAGCKTLLQHKQNLENNIVQNAEHIYLLHNSDCCTSSTFRVDISERVNIDFLKLFPQTIFIGTDIFNNLLKSQTSLRSLKFIQSKEFLIQSNIFKEICSYII